LANYDNTINWNDISSTLKYYKDLLSDSSYRKIAEEDFSSIYHAFDVLYGNLAPRDESGNIVSEVEKA